MALSPALDNGPLPETALVAGFPVGVDGLHGQPRVHEDEHGGAVGKADLDAGKIGCCADLNELDGLAFDFGEAEKLFSPELAPDGGCTEGFASVFGIGFVSAGRELRFADCCFTLIGPQCLRAIGMFPHHASFRLPLWLIKLVCSEKYN